MWKIKMNKKFNEWWDEGLDTKDNPFRKSSPAYWAWEGWVAGSAAEREACAQVAENGRFLHDDSPEARFGKSCAAAIRARGLSEN
jgi:hypothetical protein